MRLAATIPAALSAAALLAAAAPADAATGNVHTWQAASQGRTAMHGAMTWTTDENMGSVAVDAWLQRYQRHGWGPITWHSWDRRSRIAEQSTDTGTSGGLTVTAACRAGQWRVHVDTTVTVVIHGAFPVAAVVHDTHNSHAIRIRRCR